MWKYTYNHIYCLLYSNVLYFLSFRILPHVGIVTILMNDYPKFKVRSDFSLPYNRQTINAEVNFSSRLLLAHFTDNFYELSLMKTYSGFYHNRKDRIKVYTDLNFTRRQLEKFSFNKYFSACLPACRGFFIINSIDASNVI